MANRVSTRSLGVNNFQQIAFGIGVFALLAGVLVYTVHAERQHVSNELRTSITREATFLASRLETELQANTALANGLAAHISAQPDVPEPQITRALGTLFKYGRYLRNIGIAPANRLRFVYPREGNETAIGLYYPDSPRQWPGVSRAMETRDTILAGPVPLRQGGMALISRTPVYLNGDRYWGVISLVMNTEELWKGAGLTDIPRTTQLALRGVDGLGQQGAVFLGSPTLFEEDAVLLTVSVPGGTWQMAAYPINGWHKQQIHLDIILWLGLALAALIGVSTVILQRDRERIAVSERRLAAILETTPDGVVVVDEHGLIHEFNAAAEQLFGYQARDVMGSPARRLIVPQRAESQTPTSDTPAIPSPAEPEASQAQVLLQPGVHQYTGYRQNGDTLPVEITVGRVNIADHCFWVGVVRDVTERQALDQHMHKLATTDSLTGAFNRRAFLEIADKAYRLAQRHRRSIALLMIDADHFKNINDTYGHEAGDRALSSLATTALNTLRSTDVFGRFGGEEFMALLPETSLNEAKNMAERLRTAIRRLRVPLDDGRTITVTVSIGVTASSDDSSDLAKLLRDADRALYQAKSEGRDRCRIAHV